MEHSNTNRLIHETSPYLLQHAHNPVDWYPWGDEALEKAKREDKPILVSIGYAACHWCHVMERESFEDEATAAIMNVHFINIKIDREERPDLDHIYMDAVQAMSGHGGWPLNVFLTPEAKPFYGGTYFPPQRAFNRSSWKETLQAVVSAYKEKRHEIDAQAENLTDHLFQANTFGQVSMPTDSILNQKSASEIFKNAMNQADTEWGGFGKAPKFPQTFTIQFLLRYSYSNKITHEQGGDTHEDTALKQALVSLDKMIEGGIYDQVGGGFARYSTDTEWLAPHFEKMLYDNALLVSVLSEAFQLTGNDRYQEVIHETMEFVQREMLDASGGFYSALDADSEGEEGKFYVWHLNEIKDLLGDDAEIFSRYYDVTEHGNWEEKNILRIKKSKEVFAVENDITLSKLNDVLEKSKKILLTAREKRIRPLLDDKIILGWNALMNTATSKAFAATGKQKYRELAVSNMEFIFKKFQAKKNAEFFHTWKNDVAKFPAFIDDYAFLIQALIHLQEITTDRNWLLKANSICEHVIENFSETGTPFFYYTTTGQKDVIIRKKEVYDGAVPSGNSIMAYNLYQLGWLFDKPGWKQRAIDMVSSLGQAIRKYPTSFGIWSCLLLELIHGTNEISIVGNNIDQMHRAVLREYVPHRVLMATDTPDNTFPLLQAKQVLAEPCVYLCRNYTCLAPVFSVEELMSLINTGKRGD